MRSAKLLLGLLVSLALVAAACGGGGGKKTGQAAAKKGGCIVVGAEQWPDCLNPVTQCANSSWMFWITVDHVLPRLMELDPQNNFKASAVLTEAPNAANGGI